ncbi:hypothetical protein LSH36_10g14010 [Paralvinella palmiformis]|uniref:Poly(A)-specific ribonuclease RNA-binding domain-containing protein n=1 Tax=Paralvinella palmiformis TaxID=53620 RepID=A0AAD9KE78_9ANNE|nr:hypothetical protein LSH36_10g14010 [Paralvinella palmiformis]
MAALLEKTKLDIGNMVCRCSSTFITNDINSGKPGLSFPGYSIHPFETPEDRYLKLKTVAANFLILQFGLAVFKFDPKTKRYSVKVYNFYIFPRPFSRRAPDIRFTCQSSSLDFLASQDFDFNKVFREGISYLLPSEEDRLKAALNEKYAMKDSQENQLQVNQKSAPSSASSSPAYASPQNDGTPLTKGPCIIPEEQKSFIEGICSQVDKLLQSGESELHLKPSNGYQRKLTYQVIGQRFNGVHLETKSDSKHQRYILVTAVSSPEELRDKEEKKKAAEFQEVEDAVGFTKVIKMLIESRKLIVGHNMLLDLLHLIEKFCYPLPEEYEEFKALAASLFPKIIDTKLMASAPPFKDKVTSSVLGELLRILEEPPFSIPEIEQSEQFPSYSTKDERQHEAGYDAYMTGLCFLAMAQYLEPNLANILTASKVEQFMNKLFLMRIVDIPYINLKGDDVKPDRDHIFHVRFPKDWKTSDISQLFSQFGSVYVAWLDESSVYVALNRRDQAEMVMKALPNTEHYQISRYSDYVKRKTSFNTPTGNGQKKRLESPVSDPELPRKKRKASRESLLGIHTFPTIHEEEENRDDREDGEIISGTESSGDGQLCSDGNGVTEDLGKPVKRKKSEGPPAKRKKTENSAEGDDDDDDRCFTATFVHKLAVFQVIRPANFRMPESAGIQVSRQLTPDMPYPEFVLALRY